MRTISLLLGLLMLAPLLAWAFVAVTCKNFKDDNDDNEDNEEQNY